ncbi:MAG: hypothetical protein PWQ09_573 [Candidatus Cloacimonadota bacterium]|nr:hypothetical protein [Candidatus Cloacimonadota bacterium]
MKKAIGLFLFVLLIVVGCDNTEEDNYPTNMQGLNVSPDFDFNTTMQVSVKLTSQNANGEVIPNAPFSLYKENPAYLEDKRIIRASTNNEGDFEDIIVLPNYYRKLYIQSGIGEIQELYLNIIGTEEAEINAFFTYDPTDIKGLSKFKISDKFESVTASDNGFDITLHTIFSSTFNATFVFSVTNNHPFGLDTVKFGLPANSEASYPTDGETYTSPTELYTYNIENPTDNPFRAIAFETIGEGYKNGDSDFFIYTVNLAYLSSWDNVQVFAKAGTQTGQVTLNFDYNFNWWFSCQISYPSETEYATLAFEDYWPLEGDYDMNDLVIDYNFTVKYKDDTLIKEIILAKFHLRAIGASYHLGFGFQLPENLEVNGDITSTNGLAYVEADNRTIILFDDARDVIPDNPGQFINTDPTLPYTPTFVIGLAIPVEDNWWEIVQMGPWNCPPYNPFIFVGQRSHEIHLANYPPTLQADFELFGTDNDASDPESDVYYRTTENLPWAFNIGESTVYPIEKTAIIQAFNYFAAWANSDGNNYQDWYKDEPGYRNNDLIYQEP